MIRPAVKITHRPTGQTVIVTGERSYTAARRVGLSFLRSSLHAPPIPSARFSYTFDVPYPPEPVSGLFPRSVERE